MIGKLAFREETQQRCHKITGSTIAQGWDTQLKNDLLINYIFRVEKGGINKPLTDLNYWGEARLGSLYTDASVGLNIRFGIKNDLFSELFLAKKNKKKWEGYLYLTPLVKVVGYDASLQGGLLFRADNPTAIPSRDVSRLLFQYQTGMKFSYRNRIGLEVGFNETSRTFKKGRVHRYGFIQVSIRIK